MQVVYLKNSDLLPVEFDSAIALGNFDGVHIAHQELLKQCVISAKNSHLVSTVVTFNPHPKAILGKNKHAYLTTLDEKLEEIAKTGIEYTFIIDFDEQFSKLGHEQFLKEYLCKVLNLKKLFTGYDFQFGHKRMGNVEYLTRKAKELNFQYKYIDKVSCGVYTVSSSVIKKLIHIGALGTANKLLGRNFSLEGEVIRGAGLGKKFFDAPTANIGISTEKQLPLLGVYLIKANYNKQVMYGVANIGYRPSINEVQYPLLEVHFFDQDMDLYGQVLKIELLHFLRPERHFEDLNLLKEQILNDINTGTYVHKNLERLYKFF